MIKLIKPIMLASLACTSILLSNIASAEYTPMDGSYYQLNAERFYEMSMNKVVDQYGHETWQVRPFACYLKTDYAGAGGIKVTATSKELDGAYHDVIVYQNNIASFGPYQQNFDKNSFRQPFMQVINKGCSKYNDGDMCKYSFINPAPVYIACKWVDVVQ